MTEYYDLLQDENIKTMFESEYIRKLFKKRRFLVELEKKDILAMPGDDVKACYYVDEGIIISYEKSGKNRRIYDFFDSGMFIFLEETLMDYKCALTYEAQTPVKLYSIDVEFVRKLWKSSWQFNFHCMKQMSRDYLLLRSEIRKEASHSAEWRVANLLLELCIKEGKQMADGVHLSKSNKKIHLANLVHMNRVTFHRSFNSLEEKGLCTEKDYAIVIKDIDLLREYRDSIDNS